MRALEHLNHARAVFLPHNRGAVRYNAPAICKGPRSTIGTAEKYIHIRNRNSRGTWHALYLCMNWWLSAVWSPVSLRVSIIYTGQAVLLELTTPLEREYA